MRRGEERIRAITWRASALCIRGSCLELPSRLPHILVSFQARSRQATLEEREHEHPVQARRIIDATVFWKLREAFP